MWLPTDEELDAQSRANIAAAVATVPPLTPEMAARLAKALRLREFTLAKAAAGKRRKAVRP